MMFLRSRWVEDVVKRPDRNAVLSSRSVGRFSKLYSSIWAPFRTTRQNVYRIGQADLMDGRFVRLASKLAGEQNG